MNLEIRIRCMLVNMLHANYLRKSFLEKPVRKIITQAVHNQAKEEPGGSILDSNIKSLTSIQMCLNSYLNY